MPLHFFSLVLFFSVLARGASTSAPTAVVLCYPTDKITKSACDELEKKLNQCETARIKVVRRNNLPADSISKEFQKEGIPSNVPVFIVGHGMADLDHRHYLAIKMFWKDHPEMVKTERIPQLIDEGLLVSGKQFNSEISKGFKEPALWYLSCHSGGNCTEGGNIGASCSSWEATSISQLSNSLLKVNLKIDPATRAILNLLCTPGEFDRFDSNHSGYIEDKEWLKVFSADEEKRVTLTLPKDKNQIDPNTRERVLKQLSSESEFCEIDGKIDLTQKTCVNAGSLNGETCLASPVLSHFALPSWEKQNFSSDKKPHSKIESTHK